jgi:hypothetical protein
MKIRFVSFLFSICFLFVSASCQDETPEPNNPIEDCNCDRVMEHTKFYVVGNAQANPPSPGFYSGTYVLINDCSGVQYNGNWSSANGDSEPVNGECYSH